MLPFNKRVKVLILLGAALVVNGQQKPAGSGAAEDAGAIFRADTRLVVCHATVVDKNGHLVTAAIRQQMLGGLDHRQQRQHAGEKGQGGRGRAGSGESVQPRR